MLNGSVANEQRRKRPPCKQMILAAGAWEKLWTLGTEIFLASKQAEITIGATRSGLSASHLGEEG